jgi:hypothetical protein
MTPETVRSAAVDRNDRSTVEPERVVEDPIQPKRQTDRIHRPQRVPTAECKRQRLTDQQHVRKRVGVPTPIGSGIGSVEIHVSDGAHTNHGEHRRVDHEPARRHPRPQRPPTASE